ncbi:MAG TPA: tetratricopeptide repeat protein [Sphingomicrobium sp.]|nr:tetratricopeptide repeat protein [Sphingomicrobium sp.]
MAPPISDTIADDLREELRAGRWKQAIALYERHLTADEKRSGECRLAYAAALIRSGRVASGVKILAENPSLAAWGSEDLRRWVVKPLVDSGETGKALAVLDSLVAGEDPAIRDLRLRASLLGRQKKWDEAIADAARAVARDPRDPGTNSQYLLLLIQGGRVEEAGRHAAQIADFAADNGRLALAAMLALARSGQSDRAAVLAREAAECESMDCELAGAVVRTLFETGRYDHAVEAGERLLDEGWDGAAIRGYLGEAHLARPSGNRFEKAIGHLRKGVALDPGSHRMNAALGEALLRQGSYDEAVRYLSAACELRPKNAQTRALHARALKQCRRFAEAAVEFRRLLKLQPSSPRWQRYAAGALSQAGRRDEARKVFDIFVAERAANLPDDFEKGLAALWDKLDEAAIPKARLDWAWSLRREELGNDREEWERRAKWGHLADHYLLDWLECRDTQVHEPMRRLSDLAEAEQFLGGIDVSNGLIVAAAHVGPMYAGPLALELLGVPTRWVASTPSVARTSYAKSLISTSDQEDMQIAQAFMRSLRQKYAVVIGVDGAINLAAPRIMFEGQEITYSSFAARTAHRMGVPSIFAAPLWRNGKIGFMLRKLPDPVIVKNPDEYADLWRTSFLGALREFLGGAPESLRLSGGIWRHVR